MGHGKGHGTWVRIILFTLLLLFPSSSSGTWLPPVHRVQNTESQVSHSISSLNNMVEVIMRCIMLRVRIQYDQYVTLSVSGPPVSCLFCPRACYLMSLPTQISILVAVNTRPRFNEVTAANQLTTLHPAIINYAVSKLFTNSISEKVSILTQIWFKS